MLIPLTPEQQKLVADNYNLIFGFCKKYGLDSEDWHGNFAICLCNAAQNYNSSQGTFATLAYKYMLNDFHREHYLQQHQKRNPKYLAGSLDELIDEDSNSTFGEILGCEADFTGPEVEEILSLFTPRQQLILRAWLEKCTRSEMIKLINRTPTVIWQERVRMKAKVLAYGT